MRDKRKIPDCKKSIMPTVYLFISIVIIGALYFFLPVRNIIPFPFNLIGLVPLLFGVIINLLADKAFRYNKTTVKPFQPSAALITTGVFRMSRNPMYLGFVCILVGIAILTRCLSAFVVPIVFTVLIDRVFICTEEKMLQEQFGKEWQDYKTKTRRWI
jgi:protein-S-isoprenylcysteine O-methyltransferase Ste14